MSEALGLSQTVSSSGVIRERRQYLSLGWLGKGGNGPERERGGGEVWELRDWDWRLVGLHTKVCCWADLLPSLRTGLHMQRAISPESARLQDTKALELTENKEAWSIHCWSQQVVKSRLPQPWQMPWYTTAFLLRNKWLTQLLEMLPGDILQLKSVLTCITLSWGWPTSND